MATKSQIRQLQTPDRDINIYPITLEETIHDKNGELLSEKLVTSTSPTAISPPTSPYLMPTDIVDDLASTDTDKPLSANQGKVLKNLIDSHSGVETLYASFPLFESQSAMFDDTPITTTLSVPMRSVKTVYCNLSKISSVKFSSKQIISVSVMGHVSDADPFELPITEWGQETYTRSGIKIQALRLALSNMRNVSVTRSFEFNNTLRLLLVYV